MSTPASLVWYWGRSCCSTEGLGATRPVGYSGLYVYIYMVLILSPSSGLHGASKHLGVSRSGFHQHPNATALRCSCFPLSLGRNPWRSQSKESCKLSSHLYTPRGSQLTWTCMQSCSPLDAPKCQQRIGEWGCLHSPRRAPRSGEQ